MNLYMTPARKQKKIVKKSKTQKTNQGFTLIELLVVIAIVGLLSSLVLLGLGEARARARDAQRIANIRQLHNVLELYRADNGEYPKTFNPGEIVNAFAYCEDGEELYIPGVVPDYITLLPTDPKLDCDGPTHAWFYASNGLDYKLVTHIETAYGAAVLIDPAWDDGPDDCVLDGPLHSHYGVWTEGGRCWEI